MSTRFVGSKIKLSDRHAKYLLFAFTLTNVSKRENELFSLGTVNKCFCSKRTLTEICRTLGTLPSSLTWCVQVLRSPKEAFAAAMQLWRERCEKCVCLQGDYFEK